jgi:hypothetical protein
MYTVGLDVSKMFTYFISPNLFDILSTDLNTILSNGVCNILMSNLSFNVCSIDEIREVLVGSLLGDGTIEMGERSINARFKMPQTHWVW